MEDFVEQNIGFNVVLEYGKRKCQVCEKMRVALHAVSWQNNGRYPASVYAVCMPCANKLVGDFASAIAAAKNEDAYMLGAKL